MEFNRCSLAYTVWVTAKVFCYVASKGRTLQVAFWASVVAHCTPVIDPFLSASRAFVVVDIDWSRHYPLPF
jgi:hypothetical protein